MTHGEIREVISRIGFNHLSWSLQLQEDRYGQPELWWEILKPRAIDQKARKWPLSQHMIPSEIVQTAFLALLTAQEHEIREAFTYRGESIFGPHYDVEDLVELRRANGEVHRPATEALSIVQRQHQREQAERARAQPEWGPTTAVQQARREQANAAQDRQRVADIQGYKGDPPQGVRRLFQETRSRLRVLYADKLASDERFCHIPTGVLGQILADLDHLENQVERVTARKDEAPPPMQQWGARPQWPLTGVEHREDGWHD